MKVVLITGWSGFIGSALVSKLNECSASQFRIVLAPRSLINEAVSVELDAIPDRIDVCIHCAGLSPYHNASFLDMINVNVYGTSRLLELLVSRNCSRVIFLSGLAVYGLTPEPKLSPDTGLSSPTGYGYSKLGGELVINNSAVEEVVILRLPGVYGYGSKGPFLNEIVQKLIRNQPVSLYAANQLFNSLIKLGDLTAFLCDLLTLELPSKRLVLTLGSDEPMLLGELIKALHLTIGSTSELSLRTDGQSSLVDFSEAARLGFSPSSVENCIASIVSTGEFIR